MVVLMYLTILPIMVFVWPHTLLIEQPWNKRKYSENWSNLARIGVALVIWVAFYVFFIIITTPFLYFQNLAANSYWYDQRNLGYFFWVIIFIALIYSLVRFSFIFIKEKRKERLYKKSPTGDYKPKEPQKNLIIEFIKAKYNKLCPKIDWE
jgi:amino acid transporter